MLPLPLLKSSFECTTTTTRREDMIDLYKMLGEHQSGDRIGSVEGA